ncbi:cytochrome b561 [Marinobacterium nitratireducens]|uniref:Cytochrome b561 n=1 Tax=Marinobacterium nitratireducens TaxID=518897 RepID=A0A917ZN58_9GAMM|nr:cytochrome b/b6 domain-containing protein [Marinobacterium nitratireducens]GGO86773.1 cytochrome b561 [Marinobacterium nitratireducens]
MDYRIKVWDPSIRLFHWALVGLMSFLWWSGSQGDGIDYHPVAGYCVLGLILYRILWGFVGSRYARFGAFLRPPRETLRSVPGVLGRQRAHYLSHNPLGGWMVVALLLSLLFQGLTGLGTTDDLMIDGPLVAWLDDSWVERLTDWHHFNANLLLVLIGLHLLAVLYHDLVRREGLVSAMLTGEKRSPVPAESAHLPLWAFAVTGTGAAAAVWLLLTGAG